MKGYDPANIIPGELNTKKFECLIPLAENTAKLWRDAITKTYNDIVTETKEDGEKPEKRNSVLERRKSIAINAQKRNCGTELGLSNTEADFKQLNIIFEAFSGGNLNKIQRKVGHSNLRVIRVRAGQHIRGMKKGREGMSNKT